MAVSDEPNTGKEMWKGCKLAWHGMNGEKTERTKQRALEKSESMRKQMTTERENEPERPTHDMKNGSIPVINQHHHQHTHLHHHRQQLLLRHQSRRPPHRRQKVRGAQRVLLPRGGGDGRENAHETELRG